MDVERSSERSIKAPGEGELEMPQGTTFFIPVVGIDVLGCPLVEEHVFCSDFRDLREET